MSARTQFGRTIPRREGNIVQRFAGRVARYGIIQGDRLAVPRVRSAQLDLYDMYVESKQYDKKLDWDASASEERYVPIRERKPRVIYDFPKRIVTTFAAKMFGDSVFPRFYVDGEPEQVQDENEFIKYLLKAMKLEKVMPEAMRRLGASGSVLVRFRINNEGNVKLEVYKSKFCYPTFDEDNELESVTIKYVYEDPLELDENRKPVEKWYRLDLGKDSDVLYDTPEYEPDVDPIFTPVETVAHGLGFIQAEWIRSCEDKHTVDGPSLLEGGVLSMCDEINYSLSQSSQALSYAQEPQAVFSGMDVDEVDALVKSSTKAWTLGREGKAEFLEANLTGVERASEERSKLRLAIQDVTRVVLHDPEKFSGTAQSGKALEQLNAPLVDLITEMRPLIEERVLALIIKVAVVNLRNVSMGLPAPVSIPPGWQPTELSGLTCEWPPVFSPTQEDLSSKVSTATKASSGNLIARATALKYVASIFGVTDVEGEMATVDNQKQFNTFGGF